MSFLSEILFIPENFSHIANKILNCTLLLINNRQHRICEIEFYLNSSFHPDLYVHGNDDQTKKDTWYFHRYKNGTYKNGTYKGLDIVIGNNDNTKEYGSILIRSIFDVDKNKIIEGPCLCVNHILYVCGFDNIISFTKNESLNIINNEHNFILVEENKIMPDKILYGSRIGLSEKYPEYRDKKYRYVVGPVKKQCRSLVPLK